MVNGGRATAGKAVLAALTLFGLALFSIGPQPAVASTSSNLNRALDRVMAAPNGPPGISMQIVRHGRSHYYRRGVANVKSGAKPRLRMRFRIASVAKAFSGAVTLSLVRKGKLSLYSTVGQVLPGILPAARNVTLAQVLQHTGGLPEYIKSKGFINEVGHHPGRYVSPRKIVSWVRNAPLTHRPGSRYEYSDTDNIIAGLMAQRVTGVPYMKLVHRFAGRRFGGLPGTFMPRTIKMPGPYLHGYDIVPGKKPEDISELINPSGAWASGGIVSTLPALSRFFRAYVGGRLLGDGPTSRYIRRVQRDWVPGSSQPPGPGVNFAGMALFRYRTRCGTVFGHTGSFPGYRVFAASSADGKSSIAFVANAQITDNSGSPRVSALIRRMQVAAVCHALG
jgi:D-alanyl-D-alanine carboxypeptidase